MTVLEQVPIASSTANGVTTVFPHPFKVLAADDLLVRGVLAGAYTTFVLGVHYSVTGLGADSGAVVFLSAPANGMVITRTRRTRRQRLTDYQANGDLPAATLNADLDRLVLMAQEAAAAASTPDSPTDTLRFDLADNSAGSKGAGMVGFLSSVSYAAGSLGAFVRSLTQAGASVGAALLGFLQSGTGAVSRTAQDKLRENRVTPQDFGAVGDWNGTTGTDDTAALQRWLNSGSRDLYLPGGKAYRITASLTMPSLNGLRIVSGGTLSAVIVKDFGGGPAVIWNPGEAVWENCCIDGRGTVYTTAADVGINVPSGGGFSSKLINPRIVNTGGACLRFTRDSGSVWQTRGGLLEPTSVSTAAVDHTGLADTGGVNRSFIGVQSGGTLIDFTDMETTLLVGCNTNNVIFGASSKKALITGTRISSSGSTISVRGTDHVVTGCAIAGNLDITSDANNPTLMANTFAIGYGVTNTGGVAVGRWVQTDDSYVPVWSSSGTQPTLGNGSVVGKIDRNGAQVRVYGSLTLGSTSTVGTGTYRFSIPYTNPGAARMGTARVLDAGTAFFTGVAIIPAGANYVEITTHGAAAQVSPTVPMTWTTSDSVLWDVTYNCC